MVRALAARGADVNVRSNVLKPPKREILDFRTDKNGQALQTLLTTFPRGGLTPLLFAARQGSLDATRALIDAGADVNLADPEGISPMVLAIRNGHYEVAALLLEKGADVNAGDRVNRTPLYMAVDMHSLDWIQNRPAPKAEGALDSLDLVKLLLERGAKTRRAADGQRSRLEGRRHRGTEHVRQRDRRRHDALRSRRQERRHRGDAAADRQGRRTPTSARATRPRR